MSKPYYSSEEEELIDPQDMNQEQEQEIVTEKPKKALKKPSSSANLAKARATKLANLEKARQLKQLKAMSKANTQRYKVDSETDSSDDSSDSDSEELVIKKKPKKVVPNKYSNNPTQGTNDIMEALEKMMKAMNKQNKKKKKVVKQVQLQLPAYNIPSQQTQNISLRPSSTNTVADAKMAHLRKTLIDL
jgi:hypothetical protein